MYRAAWLRSAEEHLRDRERGSRLPPGDDGVCHQTIVGSLSRRYQGMARPTWRPDPSSTLVTGARDLSLFPEVSGGTQRRRSAACWSQGWAFAACCSQFTISLTCFIVIPISS